jgi:hypothetical protein
MPFFHPDQADYLDDPNGVSYKMKTKWLA